MTGGRFTSEPVSYDDDIDQKMVASYTALGNEFLPSLSVDRACTILTIVPTVKTGVGTAKAIAAALGKHLVAPKVDGIDDIRQVPPRPGERATLVRRIS